MMATAIAVLLMVVAGFIFIPRQPAPPPSVPPPQTPSQKPENSLTEGDRVTVTGLVKEVDDKAPPWTLDVKSSNGREWKIFFDKEKIDFSKQLLIKKFQGKNIQVTGTVVKSHRKTLVEIESMNAVKIEDTSTDKN
jgi:DNA/RNA endonuclease YhcR with UshA esterase domain